MYLLECKQLLKWKYILWREAQNQRYITWMLSRKKNKIWYLYFMDKVDVFAQYVGRKWFRKCLQCLFVCLSVYLIVWRLKMKKVGSTQGQICVRKPVVSEILRFMNFTNKSVSDDSGFTMKFVIPVKKKE